jgi:hypothetical protein
MMVFSKTVCEAPTRSGVQISMEGHKVCFEEVVSVKGPASLIFKVMTDATQRHPLSDRNEKVAIETDPNGGSKKISVKVLPYSDSEAGHKAAQYRAREIVDGIMRAFAYEKVPVNPVDLRRSKDNSTGLLVLLHSDFQM